MIMTRDSNYSKEEIDKRFEDLFENETRYGIVMAIRTFGSMNIKILARIMGKTVSTIHHHISEMTKEPEVIEIDNKETTASRGIYYKLSEIANERYPKDKESVFEEEIPTIITRALQLSDEDMAKVMMYRIMAQEDFGELTKQIKRSMSYNHNIENFIINSFGRAEKALKEGLRPKNLKYPFGASTLLNLDLKVSKPRHSVEIGVVMSEFFAKLVKLKRKFEKEMDEEGVIEEERIKVYYHLFGGEMSDFEFVKDDNFDLKEYVKSVEKTIEKLYEGIEEH
ncbi:MAG: winged helix-turn-helix domain-containing protein [Candidatus Heimdallarchaeaceae archaeon]